MKLLGATKVHELLSTHPFLEGFLAAQSPKFELLKNRMARATIGRMATLRTAAGIANIDLNQLLVAIADEIERETGERPEVESSSGMTREERMEELKQIISHLHDGGDLDVAKERFARAVGDVEATEIAAMEEDLIRGGLPVVEVQRLCDVHVDAAFAQALAALDGLNGVENHYQRKENQLFSVLERHGVTGPSQVMWGVHDQIRAALKETRAAVERRDAQAFVQGTPALGRDLIEMIYKEEKILFPMALETLAEEEWIELRRGEDELGYVLVEPAASWPASAAGGAVPAATSVPAGLLNVMTGQISLEQLNLILTHLPVDVSFVDEHDAVRFYSEGPERIFPRSPAVIGRKVQFCHPPKSVHVVQDILDSFRAGQETTAEFWIQLHGRFIHIRYFAVHDAAGAYRGCLEVSQDVTAIRQLEGEQRLMASE
ncbi:MAG: DUF438 domain-containing protein [Proteobacteria bacterium]|nr:DUF438 domain-containing protein [Pseudomonadota bacterium]